MDLCVHVDLGVQQLLTVAIMIPQTLIRYACMCVRACVRACARARVCVCYRTEDYVEQSVNVFAENFSRLQCGESLQFCVDLCAGY